MTACPGRTGETATVTEAAAPGETTEGGPGVSASPHQITEPSRARCIEVAGAVWAAKRTVAREGELVRGLLNGTPAPCTAKSIRERALAARARSSDRVDPAGMP